MGPILTKRALHPRAAEEIATTQAHSMFTYPQVGSVYVQFVKFPATCADLPNEYRIRRFSFHSAEPL
jgi:hypothetical protein